MADVLNVKDAGAKGDGVTNDYPVLQAVFDLAFGSSSSPHGAANATLNKPVFFPSGQYNIGSNTLNLTRVVGGHIYGSGTGSTVISGNGTLIAINGASNLVMERFTLLGGGVSSPLLDIDWDHNSGGGGLNHNVFREILFGGFDIGAIIAKSGFDGADNLFEQCTFSGQPSTTGLEARGASAINNVSIMGGCTSCTQGYYCSGGSIHVFEQSSAFNTFDIRVDSNLPICVIGGRSESGLNASDGFLKVSSGLVTVRGINQGVSAGKLATITGGKVSIDGMLSGCVVTGSGGSLYLRGNSFTNGSVLTGYSGTVVQNI